MNISKGTFHRTLQTARYSGPSRGRTRPCHVLRSRASISKSETFEKELELWLKTFTYVKDQLKEVRTNLEDLNDICENAIIRFGTLKKKRLGKDQEEENNNVDGDDDIMDDGDDIMDDGDDEDDEDYEDNLYDDEDDEDDEDEEDDDDDDYDSYDDGDDDDDGEDDDDSDSSDDDGFNTIGEDDLFVSSDEEVHDLNAHGVEIEHSSLNANAHNVNMDNLATETAKEANQAESIFSDTIHLH